LPPAWKTKGRGEKKNINKRKPQKMEEKKRRRRKKKKKGGWCNNSTDCKRASW
jgi:hypothetical protein